MNKRIEAYKPEERAHIVGFLTKLTLLVDEQFAKFERDYPAGTAEDFKNQFVDELQSWVFTMSSTKK